MAVDLAAAVAVLQEDRVLLIQRTDAAMWALPSGKVEGGESIAQAAIREVQEETGLIVQLDRLVGIYSLPNWHSGGNHTVLFAGHPVGGVLQPQAREALAVRFFSLDELPAALLWWHRQRVHDAMNGAGGSVAWVQDVRWPFVPNVRPHKVLGENQRSEADKQALYYHYFGQRMPGDEMVEVGQVVTMTDQRIQEDGKI